MNDSKKSASSHPIESTTNMNCVHTSFGYNAITFSFNLLGNSLNLRMKHMMYHFSDVVLIILARMNDQSEKDTCTYGPAHLFVIKVRIEAWKFYGNAFHVMKNIQLWWVSIQRFGDPAIPSLWGQKAICLLMYHFIFKFLPQAPELAFRMENISGWTLGGSIPGTVFGVTSLTMGIAGKALYLGGSGSYVDLGIHPGKCFSDPEACTDGVTFSLWLMVHSGWTGTVFDNGGHGTGSRGYFMRRTGPITGGTVMVQVKTNSLIETYRGPTIPYAAWKHIVFTWSRGNGTRGYMNGCDADPEGRHGYYQYQTRKDDVTEERAFFLGKNTQIGQYGNQNIDEFYIWHKILQPDQVWQLFLQGGVISAWPCGNDETTLRPMHYGVVGILHHSCIVPLNTENFERFRTLFLL